MTYQQSFDLAELEADSAFERYLETFDEDEHPEVLEQLNVKATIARDRYYELNKL